MRRRMSMVGYPMAAVAVVSLGIGLGAGLGQPGGGGNPARAAVAHCGRSCISMYSRRLGPGLTMNTAIPANTGLGGKVGSKLNLSEAADELPDGDFTLSFTSQVLQFCGTDDGDYFAPVSHVCQHDANFPIVEAEWTPYGNSTGLCVGVAVANRAGQKVTLRPCGVSDHTLWIADVAHGTGGDCHGARHYCPWMNASDSSFRSPQVLTMDGATHGPADQLRLTPMNTLTAGHRTRAWNNQLFAIAANKNG